MNRWNIPDWLEREIIERDRQCVYCGVEFNGQGANRRERPSWEHIINDARIVTPRNIARCCIGCNASKGKRDLVEWFGSEYCANRRITPHSVALVVRSALHSRQVSDAQNPSSVYASVDGVKRGPDPSLE